MIQKTLTGVVLSTAIIIGLFSVIPSHAFADFNPFNPIDPFCLFSCDDNGPSTVYNTNTTGSYNTNSYNNSNSPVYTTPVYTSPVYNTPIYTTPVYNYNNTTSYNSPLSVSCYPTPTSVNVGSSVSWGSSVSGGNGSYYISWSGTEGLNGNGSSITKSYSYAGSKNASITVISDGQTVSQNCSGTITVYDYNYNYTSPVYNYNTPVYTPSVYYSNPTYYSPITVSCSSNVTFSPVGSYVTWTAYPTAGNNSYYGYTYSWSGTDNLYGSQSSISTYYNSPGLKYAYVTVYSNGQTASAQCSNTVTVGAPIINYNTQYNTQYTGGVIQLACAADVTSTKIGTPVTWYSEAYGGTGRFVYSWSGTDNLFGTQSSAITSYSTPGTKSAIVTVTASNGQSLSKVCRNTVTVKSAYVAKKATPVVAKVTPTPQVVVLPTPQLADNSAASLLSLHNVPWGWIAILVILVLLGMVFYLLFNQKKI